VSKTTADILDGLEDVTEWDEEELLRGQRRSKNGNFVGRPPKVIAQAVYIERHRRTMKKATELLRQNTLKAVRVLVTVATDETAPRAVRVQAAQLIIERVLGKTPATIEIKADPAPWLRALKGAIQITPGDDDFEDDFIDAEIIEDD
jgi:hypothetical protein